MNKKIFITLLGILFTLNNFAFSFANEKINDNHTIQENVSEHIVKNEISDFDKNFDENFEKPEFGNMFIKMILTLIGIIALFILTIWSLKKMTKNKMFLSNNNKNIKILEKRALSPKSILYLIECDGKKMLVSESHLDTKFQMLQDKKN